MHNIHSPHNRLVKRQKPAAGVPLPPGFTLTTVTLTETFRMPRTTLVETEVVTMPVPVTTQDSPRPDTLSSTRSSSSSSSSSSTASRSSTTTSSSSVVPSPSTTSSATPTITSSSPSKVPPSSLPPTSVTVTAKPSNTANPSKVDATSKGLSGGAIGGIVAAVVLVGIVIVVFALRKVFLRRRQQKRGTWGAGLYPKPDYPNDDYLREKPLVETRPSPPPALSEKPRVSPPPPSTQGFPQGLANYPLPPPPPMSYNNLPPPSPTMTMSTALPPPPIPVIQTPVPTLQPAMGAPAVTLTPAGPTMDTRGSTYAYVRCTFIPSLPDELSITTGELVRLLGEFDDGWALCANSRGEQGVVPLECLDKSQFRSGVSGYMGEGTGDWRMSRRASSLYANSPQGLAAMHT